MNPPLALLRRLDSRVHGPPRLSQPAQAAVPPRNLSSMSTSKSREPGEMKHLSDQDLMRIVQAGDYSPASEIYDRYSGRIYNFAFRFLKNAEAAEDATQEVFVKMLRHANQFHGDAKLSTWLFSITANWCRDYLRKADNKA